MANMVKNRLVINGTEENVSEIFNWIIGTNTTHSEYPPEIITFNREYLRNKYGSLHPNFSIDGEWTRDFWGHDYFGMVVSRHDNLVTFATNGRPLVTFIQRISFLFPTVQFRYEYADEDYGSNVGSLNIQDGTILSDDTPTLESNEMVEFLISVWGESWRCLIEDVMRGGTSPPCWGWIELIKE